VIRAQEFKEFGDEITISTVEWLYEYIYNKYGLVKIAERKFYNFLGSCS